MCVSFQMGGWFLSHGRQVIYYIPFRDGVKSVWEIMEVQKTQCWRSHVWESSEFTWFMFGIRGNSRWLWGVGESLVLRQTIVHHVETCNRSIPNTCDGTLGEVPCICVRFIVAPWCVSQESIITYVSSQHTVYCSYAWWGYLKGENSQIFVFFCVQQPPSDWCFFPFKNHQTHRCVTG